MTPNSPKLTDIDALSGRLQEWSGTRNDYPRNRTVASLFEEIASTYTDQVAVISNRERLTYSELNIRANRLAHRLRRMGVGPEVMVGCCMERSAELIVALLAILKAGGAYVPLDPSYPKERLEFLLNDTRTPLILTQTSLASGVLANRDLPLLNVEDIALTSATTDDVNPEPQGHGTKLAYVMYTSGSTGRPKGVMVENRSIIRLVQNTNYCCFGPDEVSLQFAPISFDASTFEIWGALLNGGRLVLMPPQASALEDLGRVIRTEGVTTLWLTAPLFSLMVEQRLDDLRSVRQLLAGGDVLSPRHVRACLQSLPNTCIINGYGPTENTTFTCCHVMRPGDRVDDPVPIGKPISNTQVFILNEKLEHVPWGEPGELYTSGDGLARGYLNDSAATAAKFLRNPFSQRDERIYRTGDLARWREDGVIEFLGRIDDQVKVLGHRIEPGEIESVLGTHPGVKQVCVVPQTEEDGSKRLAAFYVPLKQSGVAGGELRDFAAQKLPHYMIPAVFFPLSSLPLSANGKVDRTALAKLDTNTKCDAGPVQAPATQLEAQLTELWQRVLRVPRVDLDDNFFDLGGDSLLLMAVHSNAQKLIHAEIPLLDLFEFTTVRKLARHLTKQTSESSLIEVQKQAQRQRDVYAGFRERRPGGGL